MDATTVGHGRTQTLQRPMEEAVEMGAGRTGRDNGDRAEADPAAGPNFITAMEEARGLGISRKE